MTDRRAEYVRESTQSASDASTIPADQLVSPLEGRVGFCYVGGLPYQYAPPLAWETEHQQAELATIFQRRD